MPAYPTSNPAQFFQGAPILHVPDVKASVAYYTDVLGFVSDFGDENYAVVWRDNSGVRLFQWVRDVDAVYSELKSRGVVAAGPADRPYGIRDFSILDLNGVGVVFGQDIEAEQAAAGDARNARA